MVGHKPTPERLVPQWHESPLAAACRTERHITNGLGVDRRMLRVWIWVKTAWEGDDGQFDRLAQQHPAQACLLVGVAFGLFEWLLADALAGSLQPLAALTAVCLVGVLLVGPGLVWVRRQRPGRR
jgi:hypothetical protein